MTVISSRTRPRHRMLRLAATAALAAAALSAPGIATAGEPVVASTASATTDPVVVSLAPAANGVVAAGGSIAVVVQVTNTESTTLGDASATLALGTAALASRADLHAWTDGTAEAPVGEVAAGRIGPVAAGSSASWTTTITADQVGARGSGVYPLVATVGDRTARATLTISGGAAAAEVGVIVPLTAPARSTGLIGADELTALTAADGALTGQLDAVTGTDAILAVDPAVLASIRVLGSAAPATARGWLERLEALPNARFALQFGDADIAAQLLSERSSLDQPTSLSYALDTTAFPAAATPGTGTDGSLPSIEQLLEVGPTDWRIAWPATGTAGSEVAALLPDTLTMLPSSVTDAGAGSATVAAAATAGETRLLVYDSDVSSALREAADEANATNRAAALSRAVAELRLAQADAAGRPLLVTLDRGENRSRAALREAIAAVTTAEQVKSADLDEIASAPATPLTLRPVAPDTARTAAANALSADEVEVAQLATVLDDPSLLTAPQRTAALQLLGAGWIDRPTDWQSALETADVATATTLASVSIPPPTDVNLAAANSDLQFWVRNDLPWPVTVTLTAAPSDPRLVLQRQTVVRAGPASNTRVAVPVQAGVGNGDVTVSLALHSPTGVAIGPSDSIQVHVRADWEGIGIVVLSAGVAALLVVGFIRTIRRRRRTRAADAAAATDPEATA